MQRASTTTCTLPHARPTSPTQSRKSDPDRLQKYSTTQREMFMAYVTQQQLSTDLLKLRRVNAALTPGLKNTVLLRLHLEIRQFNLPVAITEVQKECY